MIGRLNLTGMLGTSLFRLKLFLSNQELAERGGMIIVRSKVQPGAGSHMQDKEQQLSEIRAKLKELLVSNLNIEGVTPDQIKDDDALFGEGLGLDSLDAVEIVVILQRHFGVEVKDMEKGREIFRSVNTLANYVYETKQGQK
jgi:acyl carrier protein